MFLERLEWLELAVLLERLERLEWLELVVLERLEWLELDVMLQLIPTISCALPRV